MLDLIARRRERDPMIQAFENAPEDDEPFTDEDAAAADEAWESYKRGEAVRLTSSDVNSARDAIEVEDGPDPHTSQQVDRRGAPGLAAGGADAVRIEPLARALGVTRGGFYWHFDDRRALLEEMLDTWERASIEEVIERVEREGGDARARLRRLFAIASLSDELLGTDLAVRDWARREQTVAARLRRVDNRRMDYLRSLFSAFCPDEDDVEARCMLVASLWIGNHFIAADHGARSRADVLELAVRWLLA